MENDEFFGLVPISHTGMKDYCRVPMRIEDDGRYAVITGCLLYTSLSPRDRQKSRMPSSA